MPETRRVNGGSLISYQGNEYYVGGLAGCGTGDKVTVTKCVLDWCEDTKPVRISYEDQTVIETAQIKDDLGNYEDQRLYQKRGDAILEERTEAPAQALRELKEAEPTAPKIDMQKQKTHNVPAAKFNIAKPKSAMLGKRRNIAILELVEILDRPITTFEKQSLGWGETVTNQEIKDAIERLTRAERGEDKNDGNGFKIAAG